MTDELKQLIARLSDAGLEVVCCGGAARDYLHGIDPKDFDLVVLDTSPLLSDSGPAYVEACRAAGIFIDRVCAGEGSDGHSDGEQDLSWVVKGNMPGLGKVDVIKFTGCQLTVYDVIDTFDYTLNQAWFEEVRDRMIVRTVTEYPSVAYGMPNAPVCRSHIARLHKLMAAFPEYGHVSPLN